MQFIGSVGHYFAPEYYLSPAVKEIGKDGMCSGKALISHIGRFQLVFTLFRYVLNFSYSLNSDSDASVAQNYSQASITPAMASAPGSFGSCAQR